MGSCRVDEEPVRSPRISIDDREGNWKFLRLHSNSTVQCVETLVRCYWTVD